jgi:hypothetical protein
MLAKKIYKPFLERYSIITFSFTPLYEVLFLSSKVTVMNLLLNTDIVIHCFPSYHKQYYAFQFSPFFGELSIQIIK